MSSLKVNTITDKSGLGSPSFPNGVNITGALAYANMPVGSIIQVAYAESNVSGTGTTVVPLDDTIPQNNEGNLILTCNITPIFANSKLLITSKLIGVEDSNISSSCIVCSLFLNSITDAIVSEMQTIDMSTVPLGNTSIQGGVFTLIKRIDALNTSVHTITMRAGLGGAGSGTPFRWNGGGGSRLLGGSQYTSITIQEIKQ